MQQHWFYDIWAFIGLGGAIVMVAIMMTTDTFRSTPTLSRWRDAVWLAWLAAPSGRTAAATCWRCGSTTG